VIELRPWSEEDQPLVARELADPSMMEHLGGPQSPEQIAAAHRRYLDTAATGKGAMFKVVLLDSPSDVVGSVGYWDRTWRGEVVYEAGWAVFPEHQGRGLASRAVAALVERARLEARHRYLHAFPSVANAPSNGVCRKVGFVELGQCDFEYPAGRFMRCNDWRLDLL
jgi:RimJ/RimL family protein N-acetyltransferase